MKKLTVIHLLLPGLFMLVSHNSLHSQDNGRRKTPAMGWSSWNNFHTHIDESMIKSQADFMVANGMIDVGYEFINIDDGFFGGRDEQGTIISHPGRFPSGMDSLAGYIHSKGLKAGIYSDAGINTCASRWDADTIGAGMGLYGHTEQDLNTMLLDWNYDFIKIDWCGGFWLGLDEQIRYTEISHHIRKIRPDVVFNICRWEFPGEWAVLVADSWRISGDIDNTFESILKIIDLNVDLWRYCSPGHFNDMDMLQIGRGMSYEEDKAHFSMWCMMNSPLLAGNDLRNMSDETLSILTNKEIIALNQDPFCYQARRLVDNGDLELWARPLGSTMSGKVAVAFLNRSEESAHMSYDPDLVGIDTGKPYAVKDLWTKKEVTNPGKSGLNVEVPPHGVVVLRIEGSSKPFNVFQYDKEHASIFNR